MVELISVVTCPHCGFARTEEMPVDTCYTFYRCENCGRTLLPKDGDCCIFCSYGSVPCPEMQRSLE